MPWPPKQARAIAMRYRQKGKEPSAEIERALSSSLKGVPMPHPRHKLARHMAKRKRRHHPSRAIQPPR